MHALGAASVHAPQCRPLLDELELDEVGPESKSNTSIKRILRNGACMI